MKNSPKHEIDLINQTLKMVNSNNMIDLINNNLNKTEPENSDNSIKKRKTIYHRFFIMFLLIILIALSFNISLSGANKEKLKHDAITYYENNIKLDLNRSGSQKYEDKSSKTSDDSDDFIESIFLNQKKNVLFPTCIPDNLKINKNDIDFNFNKNDGIFIKYKNQDKIYLDLYFLFSPTSISNDNMQAVFPNSNLIDVISLYDTEVFIFQNDKIFVANFETDNINYQIVSNLEYDLFLNVISSFKLL